jgi:hypothetical protein
MNVAVSSNLTEAMTSSRIRLEELDRTKSLVQEVMDIFLLSF